jgi:hypothetical protein
MKTLSAVNLKQALWETLNDIKDDRIQANTGDAIASQAREILRTVKVQLQISGQAKRAVPKEVLDFSEPESASKGKLA